LRRDPWESGSLPLFRGFIRDVFLRGEYLEYDSGPLPSDLWRLRETLLDSIATLRATNMEVPEGEPYYPIKPYPTCSWDGNTVPFSAAYTRKYFDLSFYWGVSGKPIIVAGSGLLLLIRQSFMRYAEKVREVVSKYWDLSVPASGLVREIAATVAVGATTIEFREDFGNILEQAGYWPELATAVQGPFSMTLSLIDTTFIYRRYGVDFYQVRGLLETGTSSLETVLLTPLAHGHDTVSGSVEDRLSMVVASEHTIPYRDYVPSEASAAGFGGGSDGTYFPIFDSPKRLPVDRMIASTTLPEPIWRASPAEGDAAMVVREMPLSVLERFVRSALLSYKNLAGTMLDNVGRVINEELTAALLSGFIDRYGDVRLMTIGVADPFEGKTDNMRYCVGKSVGELLREYRDRVSGVIDTVADNLNILVTLLDSGVFRDELETFSHLCTELSDLHDTRAVSGSGYMRIQPENVDAATDDVGSHGFWEEPSAAWYLYREDDIVFCTRIEAPSGEEIVTYDEGLKDLQTTYSFAVGDTSSIVSVGAETAGLLRAFHRSLRILGVPTSIDTVGSVFSGITTPLIVFPEAGDAGTVTSADLYIRDVYMADAAGSRYRNANAVRRLQKELTAVDNIPAWGAAFPITAALGGYAEADGAAVPVSGYPGAEARYANLSVRVVTPLSDTVDSDITAALKGIVGPDISLSVSVGV